MARSNLPSLICSFYFCLSSILFQNCEILYFTHYAFAYLLCTSLFVVQFSMTELASRVQQIFSRIFAPLLPKLSLAITVLLADSLDIISPTFCFVNTFFKTFFHFLKVFWNRLTHGQSRFLDECNYYNIFWFFVKYFFKKILFSPFCPCRSFSRTSFCTKVPKKRQTVSSAQFNIL